MISRSEQKDGETRTATKLVHVLASNDTAIGETTKKIVVYHQERTLWTAKIHMEMDGMEDTLKSMVPNIVKISLADLRN